MKVDGLFRFAAPRDRVWAVLQDPDALAACIPGCEQLAPLGNDRYTATLRIGVAAFKGTYTGNVTVANQQPPQSYDLRIEGSGRPGFVNGIGHIRLMPDGDSATVVTVDGDATVGGPVLSVGSRLVVPTAKLLMRQFFEGMQRRLGSDPASGDAAP